MRILQIESRSLPRSVRDRASAHCRASATAPAQSRARSHIVRHRGRQRGGSGARCASTGRRTRWHARPEPDRAPDHGGAAEGRPGNVRRLDRTPRRFGLHRSHGGDRSTRRGRSTPRIQRRHQRRPPSRRQARRPGNPRPARRPVNPPSTTSTATTVVRQSRWSRLSYRLAILIAVLLGLSAIVTTTFAVRSVQEAMYSETSQSMENVHTSMNSLISVEYQSILDFRSAALTTRKQALVDVSAPVIATLDQLTAAVDHGDMTKAAAQASALAMLKSVRFGNNDYFFTYDRNMTALAHPDPKYQGRNLIDLQDADGRFIVRDVRNVALNKGSG
ncbi:MAG: hypothetical protein F2793_02805, partial [Actinobacteria bacterium]|nr:hypothetical protein [Actinomycetota bacterium]